MWLQRYESGWPALSEARIAALDVVLIEVNPLAEFAGGGLFRWTTDKGVLLGEKPFDFRIQTELLQFAAVDIMPGNPISYVMLLNVN